MKDLFLKPAATALAALLLCTATTHLAAQPEPAARSRPVLDSPFFPFTYRRLPNDEVKLAELGYSRFANIYTGINLAKEPPYPADLEAKLKAAAKGPGVLWLTIRWPEETAAHRQAAITQVRHLADVAQALGWRTAIYPHTGDSLFTARQTLPFVKEVNHPNVGLTLNLAHELRNGQADDLLAVVDEVKDHLFVVTINGADRPVAGKIFGWDRLIQPLGRGDFDVYSLLQKLRASGYTGPIGLQCFNIPGDTAEILAESMKAWKVYCERLAAP